MDKEDTVLNMIRETVRASEPDAEIILYGSRARGDARQDSDWDISLFNLNYVKNGPLTREDGLLFANVFAFRQGSDYDDFIDASEEDVKRLLPKVENLLDKIIILINNKKQNI